MKKKYFIILLVFPISIYAQISGTVKLDRSQIEAVFLKENLALIAEKMNINIADAEIVQAKVWENPVLTVGDVNFWTTGIQRENFYDDMPNAPNTRQFSIELSQMITTAGKRRKEIAALKVSKEMAMQQFGETLRGMKIELRKSISEIIYFQQYETVLTEQVDVLKKLINAYEQQVKNGNLSKAELLRLQTSALEIESELYQLRIEQNSQSKTLKSLLNLSPETRIIVVSDKDNKEVTLPVLNDLNMLATENRPDMKLQQLQTEWFVRTLSLEKARRVPDITFIANYDRYAGLWKDYIGFGVSFDLPVFNRNQGNIRVAKIGTEQSRSLEQLLQNEVLNEIFEAYDNFRQSSEFYRKISDNELLSDLDQMLEAYTKNLLNRNISMLEFIDFMESYQKSKQIFLDAQKSANNSFEELQFTIGIDINK
jgi:cobalt-zinc-cadmium efflux system outer membrane protein